MSFVTKEVIVYRCPACHADQKGYAKYSFKDALTERPSVDVVPGSLHIAGMVVPNHNCVPPTTRSTDKSNDYQLHEV